LDNARSEGQLTMAEHRRRVDAAIDAATLDDLRELLDDLQVTDPLPQPVPPTSRNRRAAIAGGAALIVAVAAICWGVFGATDPPAEPPSAVIPQPPAAPPAITKGPAAPVDDVAPVVLNLPRHLDTVEGMTGILDEIRKRFGSTMGYELALRPEQAFLSLPDPADDERKLIYTYRGGWGTPSGSARFDSDVLVDLGAFDIGATVAAWRSAPATLQIAPGEVEDTYLDIDHVGEPGSLETLIRVTTKSGRNGYLYLDPAGAVTRVENPS
jgi:hypothetical protein